MTRSILLLAAVLAACGEGGGAGPNPDVAASNTLAAPMRTDPPAAPVPPAVAPTGRAQLTAQGWGSLRIGMTLDEVTAALGPDADPEAAGGPDPATCDQFRPARAPRDMLVMIENGRLSRISLVGDADIATDRGISVGDTAASVRAAYGAAVEAEPHAYTHPQGGYLTVWARGGEDDRDRAARGIRHEIGADDRITAIHAGGPSITNVEGCV